MRSFLLAVALSLPTLLTAQKLPLADHGDRQLQLFDVLELLGNADPSAPAPNAAPEPQPKQLQALGEFLRNFVDPPLGSRDDLQPLAGRWLAMVGTAAQIASVERLLATAKARRAEWLEVEVRFIYMSAKAFNLALRDKLVGVERGTTTTHEMVFPAARAKVLLAQIIAAGAEVHESPRLTVWPLQNATMSVINQTAYVKDFTITAKDGTFIAEPVVGVVWDGVKADVVACFEPDGTIGVSCDVQCQEVVRPIAEFQTTLPGTTLPAKIQLPRTHGVHLRQVAHVRDGELLVLAAPRADGDYLVAVMTAGTDPATRTKPH